MLGFSTFVEQVKRMSTTPNNGSIMSVPGHISCLTIKSLQWRLHLWTTEKDWVHFYKYLWYISPVISIILKWLLICVCLWGFFRWTTYLNKHAVTTKRIRIGNVRAFLKFLIDAQLPEVRASRKALKGTLFALQLEMKKSRRELHTHRQAIRIKKSRKIQLYYLFITVVT